MANNKSAIKRIRQIEKRRIRNRMIVGTMRTAIKKARVAIDAKSEDSGSLVKTAISMVDRAVTKGAVKRQTASRYISRLTTRKVA